MLFVTALRLNHLVGNEPQPCFCGAFNWSGSVKILTAKKKPVAVRMVKLSVANQDEAAGWCNGKLIRHNRYPVLQIHTLEGVMSATVGDYIVEGVQGEFYPCKSDIIKLTYDFQNDK